MSVLYKLESFEGPLDLLLHLIDKAEIDIQDISISDITDQYMAYLHAMQEIELEITSEFLVMAATLLAMKSKLLLPRPPIFDEDQVDWMDDELDPRDELIQKLIEYRLYKQIAGQLREQETARSLLFSREPEDLTPFLHEEPVNPVEGLDLQDLVRAFKRALFKAERRDFVATVQRDEISVKDRIVDIMSVLREHHTVQFSKIVKDHYNKQELVVTFLAILELMKMKQVRCFQHQLFDDIVIHWRGEETPDVGLSEIEVDY